MEALRATSTLLPAMLPKAEQAHLFRFVLSGWACMAATMVVMPPAIATLFASFSMRSGTGFRLVGDGWGWTGRLRVLWIGSDIEQRWVTALVKSGVRVMLRVGKGSS